MNSKTKRSLLGYLFGIIAITLYSVINILSQVDSQNYWNVYIYAVIFVIIKEGVASISYMLASEKGNAIKSSKKIVDAFKEDKKSGLLASLAGVCGGIIGFVLTTAGGIFIGSSFASPFYALEAVIIIFFMRFVLKRKVSHYQWIGVFLVTSVLIILPLLNVYVGGSHENNKNFIIGVILILSGVSFWSVESIIFDKISESKKTDLSVFVGIKQITSFVVGIVIVLPLFSLISEKSFSLGYQDFGNAFSERHLFLLIAAIAGFILYVGRIFFFTSTKIVGASMSNLVYDLLLLVQIPIAAIATAISGDNKYVGNIHHAYFWPLVIVIVIGVVCAGYGQIKILKGKKL